MKSKIAFLNKYFRATNTDAKNVPAVWKGLVADANVQGAGRSDTRSFPADRPRPTAS